MCGLCLEEIIPHITKGLNKLYYHPSLRSLTSTIDQRSTLIQSKLNLTSNPTHGKKLNPQMVFEMQGMKEYGE